jgi:flagellar operon protein
MATINGLNSIIPNVSTPATGGVQTRGPVAGPNFRDALNSFTGAESAPNVTAPSALKFSNHAVERMQMRGISFDPAKLERIEMAVQKAAAKGSKNTLLVTDDSALIVSVKDRTVVTVLDRGNMKDNVFTNIDSTVVI